MLPRSMWDEVLELYHMIPCGGGHRKYDKLVKAIGQRYFFHGMQTYIQSFCRACVICQRTTSFKRKARPLKLYFASYPGVTIHLDCTNGPLTLNGRNKRVILTIIDSFSGYVRLYALEDQTAESVAGALMNYIALHLMPL